MNQIKAIQTRYKGYHFRSRLEARWAVFFDSLKIKWDYEPEGFELKGNVRYLPDFYFPDFNIYAEIKQSNESLHKCDLFFNSTGKSIVLLSGPPIEESPYKLWCYTSTTSGGGEDCIDVILSRYPEEDEGEFPWVHVIGSYDRITQDAPFKFMALEFNSEFEVLDGNYNSIDVRIPHHTYAYHDLNNDEKKRKDEILSKIYGEHCDFKYYINCARSARFEHGESGST